MAGSLGSGIDEAPDPALPPSSPAWVASLASILKRFGSKFGGRPRLPEVSRQSLNGNTHPGTIGNRRLTTPPRRLGARGS